MRSLEYELGRQRQIEGMRRVLATELRKQPLGVVAGRIGIAPATVRSVLTMTVALTPEEETRLLAYCATHPAQEPHSGAVALGLLVDGIPEKQRRRVRRELADLLADRLEQAGQPIAGWLEDEVAPPPIPRDREKE